MYYRSRTPTSSRSPSSASVGRPNSVGAAPIRTSGTPGDGSEEGSAKRIKMEDNARKSGHVSQLFLWLPNKTLAHNRGPNCLISLLLCLLGD